MLLLLALVVEHGQVVTSSVDVNTIPANEENLQLLFKRCCDLGKTFSSQASESQQCHMFPAPQDVDDAQLKVNILMFCSNASMYK